MKIEVTGRLKGYAYCDGKVHDMPTEHAKDFIEAEKGHKAEGGLPEDLPGREEFLDAGHNQLEDIKEISDYTKVKGIGPATADKIKTYFEDN